MSHRRFTRSAGHLLRVAALLVMAAPATARGAGAQSPPGQLPAAAQPAYHAPTLALVQPTAGRSIPQDKPILVFRFSRGEAADPVDVGSFTVNVNGVDRTEDFQVTADEAWGPLAKPGTADSAIAPGTYRVSARVCSVRGACSQATSAVVAVADPAGSVTSPDSSYKPDPRECASSRSCSMSRAN